MLHLFLKSLDASDDHFSQFQNLTNSIILQSNIWQKNQVLHVLKWLLQQGLLHHFHNTHPKLNAYHQDQAKHNLGNQNRLFDSFSLRFEMLE